MIDKQLSKAKRNAQLRAAAGMKYISDTDSPSIEKLHRDPKFATVSLRTLERWAASDHWVERRQEFIERWVTLAKEKLGSKLAEDRIEEMELLDEIKQIGMARIRDTMTLPKSLEGVIKSVVDTMRYKEELRSKLGEIVKPADDGLGLPKEDLTDMSQDELYAASEEVLRVRRNQMRAQLGSGEQQPTEVVEAEVVEEASCEQIPPDLISSSRTKDFV